MQTPRQPSPNMSVRDLTMWAQAAHRWMMSLGISGSRGIRVSHSPRGYTLDLLTQAITRTSKASVGAGNQWALEDVSAGGTAKVRLKVGHIDDNIPTSAGTAIDADPEVTLAAGTWLYVLTLEVDANWDFVAATVSFEAAMPSADPETKGYIKLATVVSDGTTSCTITPVLTYALRHLMCGNTDHVFWSTL